MKDWRSQSHVKWDCKYHVGILPKYCVSTVGYDEASIRKYIEEQEKHERDQEPELFEQD